MEVERTVQRWEEDLFVEASETGSFSRDGVPGLEEHGYTERRAGGGKREMRRNVHESNARR